MALDKMDLTQWQEYAEMPIAFLHKKTKQSLYMELNVPAPIRNEEGQFPDFRGLSNIMNMSWQLIPEMRTSNNPAKILIDYWCNRDDSTVQVLFCYLTKLGRMDIIKDLRRFIDADIKRYHSPIGRRPENEDKKEKYDVFVSYCDEDFPFVYEHCINELEKTHGIKLFIPDRDMLNGPQQEITAQLIEDKCAKTLIILSDDYLTSPQCQFQIRYALALPQDAGINKIIPVIARPCRNVPRMLNFMTRIDYTREELRQWFWPRLAKTIKHIPSTSTSPYRGDLKSISLSTKPRPPAPRTPNGKRSASQ